MSSLSVRKMHLKGNDVLECEDAPGPAMHMHQRMCNEHGAKNGFALHIAHDDEQAGCVMHTVHDDA